MLGFAAVNTGNNLLFLVVSGLLGFMSITGLAGVLNLGRLVPELLPPAEVFAGAPAMFRIRLHNRKRLLPSYLITVSIPGETGANMAVLPAGTSREIPIAMSFAVRGRARLGSVTLSSTYPVSFFTRFWTIPLDGEVIVFPGLIPSVVGGQGEENRYFGQLSHHLKGADGELERITAYSGREPLRMIHWKHSARNDELVVKEHGVLSARPLMLELDEMPGSGLEERISRAAWVVREVGQRRPVGLKLAPGLQFLPATGHRHCLKLLTELALYGQH